MATSVSIFDREVYQNLKGYFDIGAPAMMIIFLDWSCVEGCSLMSGYIGVTEQACTVIILNLTALGFMAALGLSQSSCALVGHQIGCNNIPLAKKYFRRIMSIATVVDFMEMAILYYFRN